MKWIVTLLATLVVVAPVATALENMDLELNFSGAKTNNLFNDASDTKDVFSKNTATVKFYHLPYSEVQLRGEYTYYRDIESIRSYLLGARATCIPVTDTAGISVYLTVDYQYTDFKSDLLTFNTTKDLKFMASVGYQLSPETHLRTGTQYKVKNFTESGVDPKTTLLVFGGGNHNLGRGFSLDLEMGYQTGSFTYVDSSDFLDPWYALGREKRPIARDAEYADSVATVGSIGSFYISPRLSFNIGGKTGMKLGFSHRSWLNTPDDAGVYGFSVAAISPWATDWEGNAVILSAKTYLIPKLIVSSGIGYFNKTYLNHIEAVEFYVFDIFEQEWKWTAPGVSFPFSINERKDEQIRTFLSVSRPFSSRSGWFIEPQFQIEFTNNSSSTPQRDYTNYGTGYIVRSAGDGSYDYTKTTFTFGVTIRL
ncbi:MAG: hypothetical protein ABIE70_04025 [bacterium]